MHYAELVKKQYPELDVRISILGHMQRGGHPSAHDRIIASRMGAASIIALQKGLRNVMIGIDNDEIVYRQPTPIRLPTPCGKKRHTKQSRLPWLSLAT